MMNLQIFLQKISKIPAICESVSAWDSEVMFRVGFIFLISICLMIPILIESWVKKETEYAESKNHIYFYKV